MVGNWSRDICDGFDRSYISSRSFRLKSNTNMVVILSIISTQFPIDHTFPQRHQECHYQLRRLPLSCSFSVDSPGMQTTTTEFGRAYILHPRSSAGCPCSHVVHSSPGWSKRVSRLSKTRQLRISVPYIHKSYIYPNVASIATRPEGGVRFGVVLFSI